MPPEETTLTEELDQTAEDQAEDSQDQAEAARLKETLNQVDIDALFGAEKPADEGTPPEAEAEIQTPEPVEEVKELSEEETTTKDVTNYYKGTVKVLGKALDVEYEGDDLTPLIQKGLAFDTYEKWDKEREAEARADEREKAKGEVSAQAALHEAAYKDLSYLYATNEDFKAYWDELVAAESGKLPGSAEYAKRKPVETTPKIDPEIEALKRKVEELETAKEAEKVEREKEKVEKVVESIIKGFSKKYPDIDTNAVIDYAVANNFTIEVFGDKALERAYHAMLGEGKLKAPDKARDDGKEVIDQIKASKKIPQIPAGTTSGRVGKVADMDLDDNEFKRKTIGSLPQNPDDLFK